MGLFLLCLAFVPEQELLLEGRHGAGNILRSLRASDSGSSSKETPNWWVRSGIRNSKCAAGLVASPLMI